MSSKYAEALDQQLEVARRLKSDRVTQDYTQSVMKDTHFKASQLGYGISDADTFFIGEEMCDLIAWAWRDMPPHPLERAHLPSPYGWAWLEKPYVSMDVRGEPITNRVISWHYAQAVNSNTDGVVVTLWSDLDALHERELELLDPKDIPLMRQRIGRIHAVHFMCWQFGWDWRNNHDLDGNIKFDPDDESGEPIDQDVAKESYMENYGWLTAFWAIISQDIGRPEPVAAPRAARKRAERADKPSSDINLVYLRRRAQSDAEPPDDDDGGPKRKMKVRAYVKPFWRRQWYPKDQTHRLILIPPHVRGPEDAPWSKRSTVKVVAR